MVAADIHVGFVPRHVIDAIGDGFTDCVARKVVNARFLGLSLWPPFLASVLKSPTSSFFLVSTEITGCLRFRNFVAIVLMCSNCLFRSG